MNTIRAERIAIRECGKPKRSRIDREKIIRLWQAEGGFWTQEMIAGSCRCSISTVRKVLREEGFEEVYDIQGTIIRKIWRDRKGGRAECRQEKE